MAKKTYDSNNVSCFPAEFRMTLPDGYRIDTEYDNDWNEVINLRGGFHFTENGDEDFDFTCSFITLNNEVNDRERYIREGKLKDSFVPGLMLDLVADSVMEAQEERMGPGIRYNLFNSYPASTIIKFNNSVSFMGVSLETYLVLYFIEITENLFFGLNTVYSKDASADFSKHLLTVIKSIQVEGKAIDIGNLTPKKLERALSKNQDSSSRAFDLIFDTGTGERNQSKGEKTEKKRNTSGNGSKNQKTGFPVANTTHVKTQLLENDNGYSIRFISQTEALSDCSEDETFFRERMTWLHPEFEDNVEELIKAADQFSAFFIAGGEQNDLVKGLLVNSAPIHALRSLLWTAVSMNDDPFTDVLDKEYWIEMAGFIASCNYVNYKPWRKNENKTGKELLRNEEVKLQYFDYMNYWGLSFEDKKLNRMSFKEGSIIDLAKTLKEMLPVIEIYFCYLKENVDSKKVDADAMRNIVMGWTVLAYACKCPFCIADEKIVDVKKLTEDKSSWAKRSEIKKYENGRFTVIGSTIYQIEDDSDEIMIPEGITDIYYRFGSDWSPKNVKKIVYPSTYEKAIYIPENVEEIVIQGDHEEVYIENTYDYDAETDDEGRSFKLRKLTFTGKVKKTGSGFDVFEKAKNFKRLKLPEGLTEIIEPCGIMSEAIYYNYIEHLYLPESLETIYDGMFSDAKATYDFPITKVYVYDNCPALEDIRAQIEESKRGTDNEDAVWVDHSKYPFELIIMESPTRKIARSFVQKIKSLYGRKDSDGNDVLSKQILEESFDGYDQYDRCKKYLAEEANKVHLDNLADIFRVVDDLKKYEALPKSIANDITRHIDLMNRREKEKKLEEIKGLSQSERIPDLCRAIELLKEFETEGQDNNGLTKYCLEKIEGIKKTKYENAVQNMNADTVGAIYETIELFESLDDYRDSKAKVEYCKSKVESIITEYNKKANALLTSLDDKALQDAAGIYAYLKENDYDEARIQVYDDRMEIISNLQGLLNELERLKEEHSKLRGFFKKKQRIAVEGKIKEIENNIIVLQARCDN